MGLITVTPIQAQVFENLERKKDIVAVSGTGTGKTVAYALPILHHLLKADKYFYALVLLPTRELSQQVHNVFCSLGKEIGLRTTLLIGGVDLLVQGKSLATRPHIIIGTPGRVAYHFKNTKGIQHSSFRYLVLDECDRLLDNDFEGEVKEILAMLDERKNTFLFTATITKKVSALKEKILNHPLHFEVTSMERVPESLVQNYIYLPQRYKEVYLYEVIRKFGVSKMIIFVSTCIGAEKIERLLLHMNEMACSIHGSKPQQERTSIIEKFRAGEKNILVATDVVARGIDIPSVRLVINYDIPEYTKDYIHRVGRTARADKSGHAITFVTQYDVDDFQHMEARIGTRMEEYKVEAKEVQSQIDYVLAAKREMEIEIKEEKIGERIKEHKSTKKGKNGSKKNSVPARGKENLTVKKTRKKHK